MSATWDFLVHVASTAPPWASAMLLGWALAITLAQPLKFILPIRWHPETREMLTRLVAFLVGCATTVIMLPTKVGLVLGLIVGVWAPFAYWLLLRILGDRYPKLRDALSGDVRGVLIGTPTENRK